MNWIQIKLRTKKKYDEPLSELLEGCGALAITYQDAVDDAVLEPLPGEVRLWPDMTMCALFDNEAQIDEALLSLKTAGELADAIESQSVEIVEDKDWQREWMDQYEPIKVSDNLWICPSWKTPENADACNIMLDPGLAFGTGTHATTFLCLRWLAQHPPTGLTVLDYGCGSGILAITAKKLGATEVYATDIDPQAIEATEMNMERNGLAKDSITSYLVDDKPDTKVNVLIANILAGPLKTLYEKLSDLVLSGGMITLSGILESQIDDIMKIYQSSFSLEQAMTKDGWALITGKKK